MSAWTRKRAALAAAHRYHPDADHTELRAELAAIRTEERIAELLAAAPPLDAERRARIAAVLFAPDGGGQDAA